MQSNPEPNNKSRNKRSKVRHEGFYSNLRGAKGESNTFSSCEYQLFVRKLCQGVTVTHLNSPQELVTMTKE